MEAPTVQWVWRLQASERTNQRRRGDTASPLSAPTVNQLTVGAGIQTFCDGHHNLIERLRRRPQALAGASDLVGRLNVLLIWPRAQRGRRTSAGQSFSGRTSVDRKHPMEILRVEVLDYRINRKTFKQQRLNRYAEGMIACNSCGMLLGSVRSAMMRREVEKFVRVGWSFLCWASQTQDPRLSRVG